MKQSEDMSAQKRVVTLPDTEVAGRDMDTLIKTMAEPRSGTVAVAVMPFRVLREMRA
jgi:hypothetical protein